MHKILGGSAHKPILTNNMTSPISLVAPPRPSSAIDVVNSR